MENLKKVTIYTDGACSGNPGPGGYGAILIYNGKEKEISGGEKNTTNNKMEMMAVIKALEVLKEIAEFMLTENGAKVETVNNGLEAVQHFEASEPGTYDVILMDVMMPVMDGLTATKTIRSLERQDAKTIPIIAMTANAFREDAEKCMEAGMNAHLAKPLDDKTIKQTICEELGSSRDR